MKTIYVLVIILTPCLLRACSCSLSYVDLPLKELGLVLDSVNLREVPESIIFEGILIRTRRDSLNRYNDIGHVFEVTDVYKGDCIDTITVWTAPHSAACGFNASLNNYSIIVTTLDKNGRYRNARSDCWKGVSKHLEPDRFKDYRDFLIAIKYGIDGMYTFTQKLYYWPLNSPRTPVVPQLTFSIINGKLSGRWWLYSRSGHLLERGEYRNNVRYGNWIYCSNNSAVGYSIPPTYKTIEF